MAEKRTILVCSCEDTMPLDADALKRGCRGAEIKLTDSDVHVKIGNTEVTMTSSDLTLKVGSSAQVKLSASGTEIS